MDSFTIFNITVFAAFLLLLMGLLLDAILNSRPIHPKQPQGFEAIERAIEEYEQDWAANNWLGAYSPYRRVRERLSGRASQGKPAHKQSDSKSR